MMFTHTTPAQHLWRQGARNSKLDSYLRAQFRHSAFLQSGKSQKSPGAISKESGKGKSSRDAPKTEFFNMSLSTDIATAKKRGKATKASKVDKCATKIGFFDMSLPREVSSSKRGTTQRSQQGSSVVKNLEKTSVSRNDVQAAKIEFFDMSLPREVVTSEPKAKQIPGVSKKLAKVADKQAILKTKFFDSSLSAEVIVKCQVSAKTGRNDQQALPEYLPKRTEEDNGGRNKELKSGNDLTSSATAPSSLTAVIPKLDLEPLTNPALSLLVLPAQTPASSKKKRKKVKKVNSIPQDYFHTRLLQFLLYTNFRLQTSVLSASPEVKYFLTTTPFLTVFHLLSDAVHLATKRLINNGGIFYYKILPKDCLITNQGCYMNIITRPSGLLCAYIGGAYSVTGKSRTVKRPFRGRLSDPPITEARLTGSAGVGRRVAQHLALADKSQTPHYKCMQEEGSRYDFRLLAAFPETVEAGAVWVLESFLVEVLGTLPVKGETGVVRYRGLNRTNPLVTSVMPLKVVLGEDGKTKKVPVGPLEHQKSMYCV